MKVITKHGVVIFKSFKLLTTAKGKIMVICFRFNHKLCCYFWLHIQIADSYLSLVTKVHLLDVER